MAGRSPSAPDTTAIGRVACSHRLEGPVCTAGRPFPRHIGSLRDIGIECHLGNYRSGGPGSQRRQRTGLAAALLPAAITVARLVRRCPWPSPTPAQEPSSTRSDRSGPSQPFSRQGRRVPLGARVRGRRGFVPWPVGQEREDAAARRPPRRELWRPPRPSCVPAGGRWRGGPGPRRLSDCNYPGVSEPDCHAPGPGRSVAAADKGDRQGSVAPGVPWRRGVHEKDGAALQAPAG